MSNMCFIIIMSILLIVFIFTLYTIRKYMPHQGGNVHIKKKGYTK